jgi:23S rRNA pseudouridine1911/1915/1917 synthase
MEFTVDAADKGSRLDIYVAGKYPGFTRASLETLFDNGMVQANGKTLKAGYKLKAGDKVQVDDSLLSAVPPKIKLPVLYEDDDVIVINKPAGILSHSKGALDTEATVASFIKDKLTDESLTGNRAGIVHRLDRATSGVIIAAKNSKALSKLQKQFSSRKVKKTYVAVVDGVPEQAEAIIDIPIERNPVRPQTFKAGSGGKPSQTHYRIIKTLVKNGSNYSLLELKPLTGRTHQLRVHLAYIGHPIVGDRVYGREADHMLLHAKSLEITLPGGARRTFEVPEPEVFKEFIG